MANAYSNATTNKLNTGDSRKGAMARIEAMRNFESDIPSDMENVGMLPIWTPWVMLTNQRAAMRLGSGMTKREAKDAARAAMDSRSDVVGMSVRRDGEAVPW